MWKKSGSRKTWGLAFFIMGAALGWGTLRVAPAAVTSDAEAYRLINFLFGSPLTVIAPAAPFFGCILGARRTAPGPRIGAAMLFGLATCLVFWLGGIDWYFRDGLCTSHGFLTDAEKVDRLAEDLLPIMHFAAVLCGLGWLICWRCRERLSRNVRGVRLRNLTPRAATWRLRAVVVVQGKATHRQASRPDAALHRL